MELCGLKFAVFYVPEAVEYVLFARNSQLWGVAQTNADEHGIKILPQVADSGIYADFLANFKLGA